jgi:hypothetical protein
VHLLHQLPLGPDREQQLDQARPQQPLRRDGWSAFGRVEPVELGIQAGQSLVDDPADLPQRVPRRDARIEIHVAEQRPRRLVRAPHHHLRQRCLPDESRSAKRVEGAVLQQPVNAQKRIKRRSIDHMLWRSDLKPWES